MSTSEVSICNRALSKLGDDTILALTDESNRARVMNLSYVAVRDAELRRRRWRFSIARASLPALAATPDSDYANQFQLPVDYLRLIEGGHITSYADLTDYRGGASALFSVEGGRLLTNLPAPLSIRYIARISDTGLFDPAFTEAFAARLAYECCERITQSDAKKEAAMADYRLAISEARRANALEAAAESGADSEWVIARAQ